MVSRGRSKERDFYMFFWESCQRWRELSSLRSPGLLIWWEYYVNHPLAPSLACISEIFHLARSSAYRMLARSSFLPQGAICFSCACGVELSSPLSFCLVSRPRLRTPASDSLSSWSQRIERLVFAGGNGLGATGTARLLSSSSFPVKGGHWEVS